MVNFKLGEEMRNDVINMSRAWDKEKSESLAGIEPWPSIHRWDALASELQRTCGKLGHIQGSCIRMTYVLRTARISNVEIVMCDK